MCQYCQLPIESHRGTCAAERAAEMAMRERYAVMKQMTAEQRKAYGL